MSVDKEQWGSRLGVILAVSGSAVGLGNFLRFPGQAAANGGGAFMIPYFCALVLLGIPICWAEWGMGRYGGKRGFHSAPAIMGVLGGGSFWRYSGVIGVLIPLAVSFYYTFIASWCLGYFWAYVTGTTGIDPSMAITDQTAASTQFYNEFTGTGGNGLLFGSLGIPTVVFWAITFGFNIYLILRGISKGIERFVSFAMPLMALCAFVVLIRVLTLGTPDPSVPDQNVMGGLAYMWNPDFAALTNPQTRLAAAGQIFFSISVGFGIIVNYASYMKRDSDVALSGLTAAATNEVFEVGFGGLITLTASFVFLGLSGTIAAVSTGTFGLGFQTLPVVFAQMGPFGPLVGAVWFFMLFLAAVTSSISMYQPAVAFFQEALGVDRRKGTLYVVALCLIGSFMVIWFTQNGTFWSTIDFWVGTFLILIMAMLEIICFSWVFGIDIGWETIHEGAQIRIPRFFHFIMKWVSPIYLLVVLVAFCFANLPGSIRQIGQDPMAQLALALIAGVMIVLLWSVRIGERRWRAEGLDLDGKQPLPDLAGAGGDR
ncbi:MAG TPA: sodium-dependent transporter [Longimicrobiales bacterium]|nr:sodium-dependent transporter [Longimicrobiales bacterium]